MDKNDRSDNVSDIEEGVGFEGTPERSKNEDSAKGISNKAPKKSHGGSVVAFVDNKVPKKNNDILVSQIAFKGTNEGVVSSLSLNRDLENQNDHARYNNMENRSDRENLPVVQDLSQFEDLDSFKTIARKKSSNSLKKDLVKEHGEKRGLWMFTRQPWITPMGWLHYSFYTIMSIFMMIVFGQNYAFPDSIGNTGTACSGVNHLGETIQNKDMCELEWSLNRAQIVLRILMGFILGRFVSRALDIWKERRAAYSRLNGAARNLIVNLGSLIPVPVSSDDKSMIRIRQTMQRWVVIGGELAVLRAREKADTEEGRKHLDSLGILADGEWEVMVKGDRHTSVWYWIQLKAVKLAEEGIISDFRLQTICNAVTISRKGANDLMSIARLDLPIPYVIVTGLLVNFNLLIYALWKGIEWAIWFYDDGWRIWAHPRIYVEIFISLSFSTIVALLFDLSQILYNPYGPREMDLNHCKTGGGVRRFAKMISIGDFPPTVRNSFKQGECSFTHDLGSINTQELPEELPEEHRPPPAFLQSVMPNFGIKKKKEK